MAIASPEKNMLICPRCKYAKNADTARFCAYCGAPLNGVEPVPLRVTKSLNVPLSTTRTFKRTKHVGRLGENEIAVYAAALEDPILITVTEEVVLGRVDNPMPVSTEPIVNMSTLQAFELGVSRTHAALRRYEKQLYIVDMKSSNGTWVDNVRLNPYVPVLLHSGDSVMLGKLKLYIYFDEVDAE